MAGDWTGGGGVRGGWKGGGGKRPVALRYTPRNQQLINEAENHITNSPLAPRDRFHKGPFNPRADISGGLTIRRAGGEDLVTPRKRGGDVIRKRIRNNVTG